MQNIFQTARIYAGHECPQFNLRHIFKRRNKIIHVLDTFTDTRLTADCFPNFVKLLSKNLPFITSTVIEDSTRYLIGNTLSKKKLIEIAWRFAGNLPTLQQNTPVYPWISQRYVEWVPLLINELKPSHVAGRTTIYAKILAGTPCPQLITLSWTEKAIKFFSRKIGFTSDRGNRPIGDCINITGMLFAGCLLPCLSAIQPMFPFEGVHCMPSMITNNKKLIDSRNRELKSCPLNFDWSCYNCFIGKDQCSRAVRLITLKKEQQKDVKTEYP